MMKMKKYPTKNIAFVMNIKQLVDGDFYHLAEDHVLRKATPDEIELIDKKILRLHGSNPDDKMNFWKKPSDSDGSIIQLPVEQWRYYVIEFTEGNQTLNELDSIFNITPTELEVGPAILSNGSIMIWSAELLFRLTTEAPRNGDNFFVDVAAPDIDIINDLHRLFKERDKGLIDISNPLGQLKQLKTLPYNSTLRFLGYFAILESLLTHPPKSSDPYDSITRQVKNKISLLNNRWEIKLDYSNFGEARNETIWSKLYAYRSSGAHGGNPDFSGELAILGSHANALKLVKEAVKSLIRQVLFEPQLMMDLRKC